MKSEILNSKLVPVSEWIEESENEEREPLSLTGDGWLLLSEIIGLQKLYDARKLHFFDGSDSCEGQILFVLEGKAFQTQRKAVLGLLIEEGWTAQVPLRILYFHSIYLIDKITVRLHHNNCLLLYLKEQQEALKTYHQGTRSNLWKYTLEEIVREDMAKLGQPKTVFLNGKRNLSNFERKLQRNGTGKEACGVRAVKKRRAQQQYHRR